MMLFQHMLLFVQHLNKNAVQQNVGLKTKGSCITYIFQLCGIHRTICRIVSSWKVVAKLVSGPDDDKKDLKIKFLKRSNKIKIDSFFRKKKSYDRQKWYVNSK